MYDSNVLNEIECLHTDETLTAQICRRLSGVFEKNSLCVAAECGCKFRICSSCARDGTIDMKSYSLDAKIGLCDFHIDQCPETIKGDFKKKLNGTNRQSTSSVQVQAEKILADKIASFKSSKELLEAAVSSGTEIAEIPVNSIRRLKTQPRKSFDEAGLLSLGTSLLIVQVTEIKVRRLRHEEISPLHTEILYELIDGERRWRSSKLVGKKTLRAIISNVDNPGIQHAISAISNFGREDHTPIEEAHAVYDMKQNTGMTLVNVAKALGKSLSWAQQRVSLLALHPDVQRMMGRDISKKKRLRFSVAQFLTSYPDQEFQYRMALEVVSENLPFNKAQRFIKRSANKDEVERKRIRKKDSPAHFFKATNAYAENTVDRAEALMDKMEEMSIRFVQNGELKGRTLFNLRLCRKKIDELIEKITES